MKTKPLNDRRGRRMEEPRTQVGALIRRRRKELRKTQEDLAKVLQCPQNYVSRLETGTVSLTEEMATRLADVLELDRVGTRRLRALAIVHRALSLRDPNALESFQRQVSVLEQAASQLEQVDTMCVPGLLQTRDYAHAVMLASGVGPQTPAAVDARLERQRVLRNRKKTFSFVVVEAALCARICSPEIMTSQLRHIEDAVQSPNITFSFLPSAAPCPILPVATFALYDGIIASVDGYFGIQASCDSVTVEKYAQIVQGLRAAAESGEAAVRAMRQAARRIWKI